MRPDLAARRGNAMKPLLLWGASGHALVLRELVTHLGYTVVALFDNRADVVAPFADVPLFVGQAGFSEWRARNRQVDAVGLVAIGGARGTERLELQEFLETQGVRPIVAIHPTAFVAPDAQLGRGCQVLAQSAVCAAAVLGDATIVNTAAVVDHECVLGAGVHVAPGARLAGCVRVGAFTLVGVGACVLPRVTIGAHCVVGAGAVVTRDLPDGVTAYGNPARIVRNRTSRT